MSPDLVLLLLEYTRAEWLVMDVPQASAYEEAMRRIRAQSQTTEKPTP